MRNFLRIALLLTTSVCIGQTSYSFLPSNLQHVPTAEKDFKSVSKSVKFYLEDGSESPGKNPSTDTFKDPYTQEFFKNAQDSVTVIVWRKMTKKEATDQSRKAAENWSNAQKNLRKIVGTQAVDFDLTDISGKEHSVASLKGKTIVLNFWFIRCAACIEEIPELNKIYEKYASDELLFFGITFEKPDAITEFLRKTEFNYPIVSADKDQIRSAFNISFWPTQIVIDPSGKIILAEDGFNKNMLKDLEKKIRKTAKI